MQPVDDMKQTPVRYWYRIEVQEGNATQDKIVLAVVDLDEASTSTRIFSE